MLASLRLQPRAVLPAVAKVPAPRPPAVATLLAVVDVVAVVVLDAAVA